MLRKLAFILLISGAATGCGNSLKHSWGNFRAYYNTYYNAEKYYRAGLKMVEEQPITLELSSPVRVHPSPVPAGSEDFQQAIDKSARILRKFPESKWADDALLLIGKSYYYRGEFYPALEKFEELRNLSADAPLQQQAIIWKGRTLLDLKQYDEGVDYLEHELSRYPAEWSASPKAEIRVIAGQHYAMLGEWEAAADLLSRAVSNVGGKKLMGRTLFLYGQVLEKLNRFGESYYAFSRVSDFFPGFVYAYWAGVKQADVSRKAGNLDLAISLYDNLRKDDKNFDRRHELTFDMARTYEMKGEISQAEQFYQSLLGEEEAARSRTLKADVYFRLGKIYSESYGDYPAAAAYFDSSSSLSTFGPNAESPQAAELAEIYGRFSTLKDRIQYADSLLWLGSLSPAELDSAIEELRSRKRMELLSQREAQTRNTLSNVNLTDHRSQPGPSTIYGFLNYRNTELVQQAKTEFRIIWGDRRRVDNWRRKEALRQAGVRDNNDRTGSGPVSKAEGGTPGRGISLDLSAIPRTGRERERLKSDMANARYELGNLLFLSLNSPDSARRYFYRVIESGVKEDIRPKAMYSLYELHFSKNRADSARYWKERILREYPRSVFARRITGSEATTAEADSIEHITDQYRQLIASRQPGKAGKIRSLALANRSSELAPHIYYEAIRVYIRKARALEHLEHAYGFTAAPAGEADPLNPMGKGSLNILKEDSLKQNVSLYGRFTGVYWDSVRTMLNEFEATFPGARQTAQISALQGMLESGETGRGLPTCKSLGIELEARPGMEQFLQAVVFPEDPKSRAWAGEVEYSFVVDGSGRIESFKLLSPRTSLGIEAALENAFRQSLRFAPLKLENPPPKVQCKMSFPVKF